ncbi:hypothetical protein LINGRAHAP2_LOCUS8613 [Linum grandiflorum]
METSSRKTLQLMLALLLVAGMMMGERHVVLAGNPKDCYDKCYKGCIGTGGGVSFCREQCAEQCIPPSADPRGNLRT